MEHTGENGPLGENAGGGAVSEGNERGWVDPPSILIFGFFLFYFSNMVSLYLCKWRFSLYWSVISIGVTRWRCTEISYGS